MSTFLITYSNGLTHQVEGYLADAEDGALVIYPTSSRVLPVAIVAPGQWRSVRESPEPDDATDHLLTAARALVSPAPPVKPGANPDDAYIKAIVDLVAAFVGLSWDDALDRVTNA